MKSYQDKVLAGESVTSADWVEYLKQAHQESPAMSPKAFDDGRTPAGLNSYQELVAELKRVATPEKILDLACGDGHLIRYIREAVGASASVLGVDMSEAELSHARKNFPGVEFKLGLAQSLHEQNESFDAVLCHMVLMLMTPLMPVVHEVHRVLKPGGVFAGVVNGSSASGFLLQYGKELASFTSAHFPGYKPNFAGDQRTRSLNGLKEVLSEGGFNEITVREFVMQVSGSPERIASFFEDMYNVSLLPPPLKADFISRLESLARAECAGGETMSFGLPMFLFSALRA